MVSWGKLLLSQDDEVQRNANEIINSINVELPIHPRTRFSSSISMEPYT
jgi:hypothetical protein